MDENLEDDDDFSLYPGGKSRLSNLFSTQKKEGGDVNQSLTYVPPKQPKKTDNQNDSENLNLIHAIAAYSYKLEKGEYTSQGKFGVAILGNNTKKIYKLLLYKGKNVAVCMASITVNFKFLVESKPYAKFQDDKGDDWSVLFQSEAELDAFAKQVVLARANSIVKPPLTLLIQDLVPGEGSSAEIGDSVTISLTGRLYQNCGFGDAFDTSSQGKSVVVLGKSNDSKGWNDGLVGAKKNMKRMMFMSSAYNYGFVELPESVTPHDVVIFEVSIHKIKKSPDRTRSPSTGKSKVEKPDIPPRTHSVSNDDIRSRGASLSEQLTQSPRKENCDIIQRMAKIGGLLLPPNPSNVQTSSESDAEKDVEQNLPKSRKQSGISPKHSVQSSKKESCHVTHSTKMGGLHLSQDSSNVQASSESEVEKDVEQNQPKSRKQSGSSPKHIMQMQGNGVTYPLTSLSSAETMHYLSQAYMTHPHMSPMISHAIHSPLSAPMTSFDSQLPMLVAETRTQNTELRFSMNKISDKLDSAIVKIDDIRQRNIPNQGSSVPYMEGDILARNIERIVQEHMKLKQDVETKNSKIQDLSEKLCEALQGNQRLLKENNSILEQRSDSLLSDYQIQVQRLQEEKTKLLLELNETKTKSESYQVQLSEFKNEVINMKEKLASSEEFTHKQEESVASLVSEKKKNEELAQELQKTVSDMAKEKGNLIEELKSVKLDLSKSEETCNTLAKSFESETKAVEECKRIIQKESENTLQYQKQYTALRENTLQMKKKYEDRIKQLVNELRTKSSPSNTNFDAELRKVMNRLYKTLQSEIDVKNTYPGDKVLDMCLNIIKRTTFSVIGQGQVRSSNSSPIQRRKSESIENIRRQSIGSTANENSHEEKNDQQKPDDLSKDSSKEDIHSKYEVGDRHLLEAAKRDPESQTSPQEVNQEKQESPLASPPVSESAQLTSNETEFSAEEKISPKMEDLSTNMPEADTKKVVEENETTKPVSDTVVENPIQISKCDEVVKSANEDVQIKKGDEVKLANEDVPIKKGDDEVKSTDKDVPIKKGDDEVKSTDKDVQIKKGDEIVKSANEDVQIKKNETPKSNVLESLQSSQSLEVKTQDTTVKSTGDGLSRIKRVNWRPQPSPPPLFDDDDEEEDEDDWLK